MLPNEYKELAELIGTRFDRVDHRLASLEDRLIRLEHLLTRSRTGSRSRRAGSTRTAHGSRGTGSIDALISRFGVLETTVATRFDDHERRIVSLE